MKATATFSSWAAISMVLVEGMAARSEGSRVVRMDTQRRAVSNPVKRDKLRRRDMVVASLDNEETLYFVNGTLGTPPQHVRLHLDTGSSDLWVNTPSSSLCSESRAPCAFAGTYTANSSSTYAYVGSWFNISYVDGTGASGDYVTDTLSIGKTTVKELQLGIGYHSSSTQGILGVGYAANEVQVRRVGRPAYNNLPAKMVADGLIQSKAYSLWLNDLDSSTGSILFGGVDSERYLGSLQTVPVQSTSGIYAEFFITLTGVDMGDLVVAPDLATAVLLDSGSSLTYLPDALVQTIFTQVGAQYDEAEGYAYVPCSLAGNKTASVTFTLSGPTITVGMDELVLDLVTSSGQRPTFQNGVEACLWGIAPAGLGTNVLGDTFLRSAYVVYDLSNNAISLAPTRFNSTKSNIREIGSGQNPVPGATAVANPVRATAGLVGANAAGANVYGQSAAAPVVATAVPFLLPFFIGLLLMV